MDIELAQVLEENAKLKKALTNLVYVVRLGKNELATERMLEEAEQLLDGSKINPDDRYEITEKGKEYLSSH
jgi:predicted transcriptional regulator